MRWGKWSLLLLLLSLGLEAIAKPLPLKCCRLLVDSSQVGKPTTINQQPSTTTPAPRFNLKAGTLNLFDPFAPSFNLAAEHIIRPRLYGHLEGGPMFNLRFFREPTVNNLKGYRLKSAIRYYLRPPQMGDYAPFIEFMYTHQYTDADIEGDFQRNTTLGRYRQRITYHMEQRKQGGFINLGLQQVYAKRFIFEFGAGLGISHNRPKFSEAPPDAAFLTNGSLAWEYNRSPNAPNVAAVQGYINLGYMLR